MHTFTNYDFLVGIAVGKILLGALFASALFRNIALAAMASVICFVYFQNGVGGILTLAHSLRIDFIARPDFSKGVALGAILAFLVFGFYRRRSASH
jgi:hypothetical protein